MSDDLPLNLDDRPPPGECVTLSPLVRRLVAPNGSPFTFTGTCSYVVGRGSVAILDPGPDQPEHVAALLQAVAGETVTHVVVTHTHRDHSPSARAVADATGATIVGCGPHRRSRPLADGEADSMEGSGDMLYRPDLELQDGDAVSGTGWTLRAVSTPGHTANHLAFALPEENALFSGDHVMAWSTTIVGPPDGSMTEFMLSLEKLRGRDEALYWPGHGGPVRDPPRFLRGLLHHRRAREASILNRLTQGDTCIAEIVPAIYAGLRPELHRAAGLSVFAHLEDLVRRRIVATDGAPQVEGAYRLTG